MSLAAGGAKLGVEGPRRSFRVSVRGPDSVRVAFVVLKCSWPRR